VLTRRRSKAVQKPRRTRSPLHFKLNSQFPFLQNQILFFEPDFLYYPAVYLLVHSISPSLLCQQLNTFQKSLCATRSIDSHFSVRKNRHVILAFKNSRIQTGGRRSDGCLHGGRTVGINGRGGRTGGIGGLDARVSLFWFTRPPTPAEPRLARGGRTVGIRIPRKTITTKSLGTHFTTALFLRMTITHTNWVW
jgi:hypothetical protein